MLFSSYEFIFLFLPVVLIIYFLLNFCKQKYIQKIFLIVASLFFYGFYNKAYLIIIIESAIVNYFFGRLIEKNKKKTILGLGIAFDILLLGYFKYTNFFISSFNSLLGFDYNLFNIILPLGISFYTFQQIAFLVDVFKGDTEVKDFLSYLLYVTFFPYVISGPISFYKNVSEQFDDSKNLKVNYNNISQGIYMFVIGLFKKAVIANTISLFVDNGYNLLGNLSCITTIVIILFYTLQIYFDFSGYSDMALGLAKMFNINLNYNFNSPYKADSVQNFWKRWHMSLSGFLTKYIYIPLGGSRKGKIRTYVNTFITFFISGLWHGASFNYIIWGCCHGIVLIFEKMFKSGISKIPYILKRFGTFIFVSLTWIFFRAQDLTQVKQVFAGLFNFNGLSLGQLGSLAYDGIFTFPTVINVIYILGILLILMIVVLKFKNSNEMNEDFKINYKNLIFIVLVFIVSILHLSKVSTFIYFNF